MTASRLHSSLVEDLLGRPVLVRLTIALLGAFPECPMVTCVPVSLVGTVSHDCLQRGGNEVFLSGGNCCP